MTKGIASSRLYFDANVFIYAVEGNDDIAGLLRALGLDREALPQLIKELS